MRFSHFFSAEAFEVVPLFVSPLDESVERFFFPSWDPLLFFLARDAPSFLRGAHF